MVNYISSRGSRRTYGRHGAHEGIAVPSHVVSSLQQTARAVSTHLKNLLEKIHDFTNSFKRRVVVRPQHIHDNDRLVWAVRDVERLVRADTMIPRVGKQRFRAEVSANRSFSGVHRLPGVFQHHGLALRHCCRVKYIRKLGQAENSANKEHRHDQTHSVLKPTLCILQAFACPSVP